MHRGLYKPASGYRAQGPQPTADAVIHFLRKIRQGLLTGNRFSKYLLYAFGEIVLVVIGILIALTISTWNEKKKERELELFTLTSLYEELSANEKELKKTMEYHHRSTQALATLMTIDSENYASYPQGALDSILGEAQWAWTFNPKMGVIKSILSTGHIKNINNGELRMFITSFEDMVDDGREESAMNNKLIVEQFMPLVNRYVGEGSRGRYLGFDLKESRFEPNYRDLFSNREFESLIAYMYLWRQDQQSEEIDAHRSLVEGLGILEEELRKYHEIPAR